MGTAYIVEFRDKTIAVQNQDALLWYDQAEAVEFPPLVHADTTWIKQAPKTYEVSFPGETVPDFLIIRDGDGDEFHVYRQRQGP
jgi:hypothetical protein